MFGHKEFSKKNPGICVIESEKTQITNLKCSLEYKLNVSRNTCIANKVFTSLS